MTVDVVGDANAFLRLAPCKNSDNGDYVANASNGAMAIDLADGDSGVAGSGVNPEAHSVFHNVFEICNQGTQPVCVDFAVDVPDIPSEADVPAQYDFGPDDPAVVFYRGSDRNTPVTVDQLDTGRPGAVALDVGECQCFGLEVRAFGFSSGRDLFENANLTIHADAGGDCIASVTDPVPQILGPTDGLIGYWPLDSVEDGTAEDIVGGNDGTVQNDVAATVGQVGDAASFDGHDDYVEIPPIQVSGSLTVAAWVKRKSNGRWQAATSQGNNSADTRNWWLGGRKNKDQVHWSIFDQSNNERVDSSPGSLQQDTFTHIVGTYDASSGEQKIYINGSQDTIESPGSFTPETSTDPGAIGAEIERDGNPSDLFDGSVDDVRVYDRALSASEVSDLYNATN
ncbi:LamG domain-containing protein [Halapricum desulfuricans]|uniref:LamG domain-containing protein n=1 Tax=Halapricum desulfuricans TaxID=2841257 RepID=UPI001E3138D5|nr:LamG domain-containing protein [Halapricum desulfuricans]